MRDISEPKAYTFVRRIPTKKTAKKIDEKNFLTYLQLNSQLKQKLQWPSTWPNFGSLGLKSGAFLTWERRLFQTRHAIEIKDLCLELVFATGWLSLLIFPCYVYNKDNIWKALNTLLHLNVSSDPKRYYNLR